METISYFKATILNLLAAWTNSTLAAKVLKVVLSAWMLFAAVHLYFYCVITLVVIDLITGTLASLSKSDAFNSRKFRKGLIEKVVLFNLLIISVWVIEIIIKSGVDYTKFYGVMVMSCLIATYELTSILENAIVLFPNMTVLGRLKGLLQKGEDKAVKRIEGKIDDL